MRGLCRRALLPTRWRHGGGVWSGNFTRLPTTRTTTPIPHRRGLLFYAPCAGPGATATTVPRRNFSASASTRQASKRPADPYAVLGVDRKASAADIKKAYYQLARKFHPDATPKGASAADKEATKEKFMAVQEAYDLLGDEKKRAQFDQFGHGFAGGPGGPGGGGPGFGFDGQAAAGGFSAEDILRSFFGSRQGASPFGADDIFGGQSQRRTTADPSSMEYEGGDVATRLSIGFMEAIKGTRRAISYAAYARCGTCRGNGLKPGRQPTKCSACGGSGEQVMSRGGFRIVMQCPTCGGVGQSVQPADTCTSCHGEGKVKERREVTVTVPPGVDSGERLRMSGRGHAPPSGRAGDLYITIQVQPPTPSEQIFKRSGADITVEAPIPFHQAILGTTTKVPTLDGQYVDIRVPPGTQPNTRRVLMGRGVQKLSQPAGIRGDQIILLKVMIPAASELNAEQRRVLEEFTRLGTDHRREFHSAAASESSQSTDQSESTEENENNSKSNMNETDKDATTAHDGFLKKTLSKLKGTLCDDKKPTVTNKTPSQQEQ